MKHMYNDKSKRNADIVSKHVKAQIISGAFPENTPLPPERELMDRFESSRTVIREAIQILSNQGFLEIRPRHRPVVRRPDYKTVFNAVDSIVGHLVQQTGTVKNLYDTRVFFEKTLVREAATSATRDDIRALKLALENNKACIEDSQEFYRTDTEFHGILYRIPQNPIFPSIHQGFTNWLSPHWSKMLRSPERNMKNFQSHRLIYETILERDPEAAEKALLDHLEQAWQHVKSTFEE